MKYLLFCLMTISCCTYLADAQVVMEMNEGKTAKEELENSYASISHKTLYGIASYYADKFEGRQTASGEQYDHTKFTAACNVIPLGTWLRVTNVINGRSVVVRTNDHLYVKAKRLLDLSRAAAEQLGYAKRGVAQVKVDVLEKEEQ